VSDGLTRRRVLVGLGVASGVSAVGLTGSAVAAPARRATGFPPMPPGSTPGSLAGAAVPAVTAGLTYRLEDMTSWNTAGDGAFRDVSTSGVAVTQANGEPLFTSVDPPVGSILKEITVWYQSAVDGAGLALFRKPLDAPVAGDPMNPTPVAVVNPLPIGDGTLQATLTMNEAIDGSATYPLVFFVSDVTQRVAGVRYGFTAPPQAFIASTPVMRVLDTRITGGKLQANETRVVDLGLPAIARSAVLNVTVTETEQTGFIAVYPDTVWPGNSSVNWSDTGQNIANAVITATDANGAIRLHGAVNPTHVVIDVQGYLL
jgi:hypothetical protein